ncbi:MAG: hypothetical protein EOQ28_19995 [Mesorhizobium sp.]|uniref:NACHT domain-containing protein n=1 Tax=Mesorhizobium sp. TaxID=1871066 RepID=UPI000FE78397|nr:hypothetical protein [Mesorhizobium sp.]RWA70661.1 MAG: hypothetical protein EOQ28_19995 [Mesorhizobium sp.]RWC03118.1 MAG: hypothetical protein EOQ57_08770 [Mesorhizobium sp.]
MEGLPATVASRRRDDFKPAIKTLLAQRVGYLCSHPECQRPTIGPRKGEAGANNIGVAAHIKAASIGGPRFDPDQTPTERGGLENGIWLCADHAHLIDHDPNEFTVSKLRDWKRAAEERAFRQLATGQGAASIQPPLEDLVEELAELRSLLALPHDSDLAGVKDKVIAGSLTQVEAFEATPRWPRHPVKLELAIEDVEGVGLLDQSRFGAVLTATQRIILLSPPGTGKTTTLIQIAREMVDGGPVPVFVPLGEWAESGHDLFGWLVGRHGYGGLSSAHLKFLAHHGELALLLDGWNEVPALARRRLIKELEGLERDFPLLKIVMSSRREVLDVPLAGRRLAVLPLSEDQQLAIAGSMRGDDGISVLDAAWRTVGLRDLVTIPLYLSSLMETTTSGKLPETKEEVLRQMVEAHEVEPANAERFHRELHDAQQRYLAAIGIAAQMTGSPTIPEGDARPAIVAVSRKLLSDGWLALAPNPSHILDILVASYLLIREDGKLYAFQHQQLQEWFASFDLEASLMAAADDLGFDHPLVSTALNDRGWAEVVLFACERMSRKDAASAKVAAKVVDLLLGIDPLFAAQLISRSGRMVWDIVGDRVIRFARTWHNPGRLDRAVGFMIASRRPEFADVVWPLVSDDKGQMQMSAMRLVRRFNPSVLGDHPLRDYALLSEKSRETFATELAFHGDRDGIDTALKLALSEPNVAIRHRVFEGLSFRGAFRQLEDLLRGSGDDLAQAVAQTGPLDGIRDLKLLADLTDRRNALAATRASPNARLARALKSLSTSDAAAAVLREMRDPAFSFKDRGAQTTHEAWVRFPKEVATALQWRIENGYDFPFGPQQYLDAAAPTDDGPIATLTLSGGDSQHPSPAPYLAGPRTVRELIRRFLEARRKFRFDGIRTEAAYQPVRLLEDRLESTRPSVFFEVLQEFAEGLSPAEIRDLSDVVSRHGRRGDGESFSIPAPSKPAAVKLINGWGRQLVDQSASRHDLAQLTWAMRRVPDATQVSILERMLEVDLASLHAAKAAFEADRSNRDALDEMRFSHCHEYRVVLTTIGTEEAEAVLRRYLLDSEFGSEAASGLQVIWLQRHEPVPTGKFGSWPDFARAAANRLSDRTQTCDVAEVLMTAARTVKQEGAPKALTRAAWFAGCAALLPHGDRTAQFSEILNGDIPLGMRRDLAQRMVVGGLIVPADAILDGLAAAISEHGDRKWIPDGELSIFFSWVQLLPMSDRPTALFEGLDIIGSKFDFSRWRIRDLLSSIRYIPEAQRIELLRGLLTRYPDLTDQHDLFLALKNPGKLTLDFLLDIAGGRYGGKPIERVTRFDYPEELYQTLSPDARDGLAARFAAVGDSREKAFLAAILLASADHDVFLTLMRDEVGRDVIGQSGWDSRSKILYSHRPIGVGTSSYELVPRDLAPLRKGLFALTRCADPEIATFAKEYLEHIDAEGDAEGGFDAGPRHPDISSGLPWPVVANA